MACDAFCRQHAVCRLLNDQPVHYFDCERFNVSNAGFQGKCDCTATADLNEVLDRANAAELPLVLADHPHTDPRDGRSECDVCGKFVWLVTHSCKGVPVTAAAMKRMEARRAAL